MTALQRADEKPSIDAALELMERALSILIATGKDIPACRLQHAIDDLMKSPVMSLPEDEDWDALFDLPHLTQRAYYLHRRNRLTVEQAAQRLGITREQADSYIRIAHRHVVAPYVN